MNDESQTGGSEERNYEAEAIDLGWKPQDQFQGDPEKWVDAKTYVERGETMLPLIKANNRKLQGDLEQTRQQLIETQRLLRANADALEQIKKDNSERNLVSIEAQIADIDDRIAAARQEDDVRTELALRDQRDELREQLRAAKKTPQTTTTQQTPPNGNGSTIAPEVWDKFNADNPWYASDPMLQAATAAAMAQIVKERGAELAGKSPLERMQMAADVVKKRFGLGQNARRHAANRVEGGSSADDAGSGGGGSGKVYSDLPPEAKAACEKQLRQIKLGEGRRFKDADAYRRHYTEVYFAS